MGVQQQPIGKAAPPIGVGGFSAGHILSWLRGVPGARWYKRPWVWVAALVVAVGLSGSATSAGIGGGYDALRYLGASAETVSGCPGNYESGGIRCPTWSGSVSFSLRITTISLYSKGWDGYEEYDGPLPEGLRWGMSVDDVTSKLGYPTGSSTAFSANVLRYDVSRDRYSRLELYFSPNGTLGRISVSE